MIQSIGEKTSPNNTLQLNFTDLDGVELHLEVSPFGETTFSVEPSKISSIAMVDVAQNGPEILDKMIHALQQAKFRQLKELEKGGAK